MSPGNGAAGYGVPATHGNLTSDSRLGVPGIEPWAEFERVMGGVSRRRPTSPSMAGEEVRVTTADDEATRWRFRCSGCLAVAAAAAASSVLLGRRDGCRLCLGESLVRIDEGHGGLGLLLEVDGISVYCGHRPRAGRNALTAALRSLRSASICASCMLSIFAALFPMGRAILYSACGFESKAPRGGGR